MHGEVGALRRRKSSYKKPAPPPAKSSEPVRVATGKDLPEQGGKGPGRERWGRGGGGETKRKPFLPFRRVVGSQKKKQKEEGREKVLGGRKKKKG